MRRRFDTLSELRELLRLSALGSGKAFSTLVKNAGQNLRSLNNFYEKDKPRVSLETVLKTAATATVEFRFPDGSIWSMEPRDTSAAFWSQLKRSKSVTDTQIAAALKVDSTQMMSYSSGASVTPVTLLISAIEQYGIVANYIDEIAIDGTVE